MNTLTVRDMVNQGYTQAHAEEVVARENGRREPVPSTATIIEPTSNGSSNTTSKPAEVAASMIRSWAQAEGIDCAPRGKLPVAVVAAYSRAHP